MTLIISQTPAYELPPAGVTPAVCTAVVSLGTQEVLFAGETKRQQKLTLIWQLAEKRADGKPHEVSRRFTASLDQRSALYKLLIAWRGRPFTDEELAHFDLKRLLGAGALLNLVHETSPDGRTYANIASVSPLPRGLPAPAVVGGTLAFDPESPDALEKFELLPRRLQEAVEQSPEWQARGKPPAVAQLIGDADDEEILF